MANGAKPFEFGLVMAGAVSAGAYTAGVIDFLLEALEAWEQAKAAARDNPAAECVPNHSVLLKAMSGASAGAMVTAIAARALATNVTPVADVDNPPDNPAGAPADERKAFRNPFYAAWVQSIDIHHLLGTRDLEGGDAPVMSILDSTALPEIGGNVLRATGLLRPARPAYVAETVDLYFTTTNLRGVPYGFGFSGEITDYHHMMTAYADNVHFALRWGNAVPPSDVGGPAVTLNPAQVAPSGSWDAMMNSALASGAFPVGLAPRLLSRPAADYDRRTWELPDEHPLRTLPVKPGERPVPVEENLVAQRRIIDDPTEPRALQAVVRSEEPLHPLWPDGIRGTMQPDPLLPPDADPAYRYKYWNVDGGVMNNEPFELVRRALAGDGNRNPREGGKATRAVAMIDPFPNTSDVAAKYKYEKGISLVAVIARLFGALVEQARFKPDDLKLAEDPQVYSRFVVAPIYKTDGGETTEPAIASATLGAFGASSPSRSVGTTSSSAGAIASASCRSTSCCRWPTICSRTGARTRNARASSSGSRTKRPV